MFVPYVFCICVFMGPVQLCDILPISGTPPDPQDTIIVRLVLRLMGKRKERDCK